MSSINYINDVLITELMELKHNIPIHKLITFSAIFDGSNDTPMEYNVASTRADDSTIKKNFRVSSSSSYTSKNILGLTTENFNEIMNSFDTYIKCEIILDDILYNYTWSRGLKSIYDNIESMDFPISFSMSPINAQDSHIQLYKENSILYIAYHSNGTPPAFYTYFKDYIAGKNTPLIFTIDYIIYNK